MYAFGPKKGAKLKSDPGFAQWMLGKGFSRNTKIAVERELEKLYRATPTIVAQVPAMEIRRGDIFSISEGTLRKEVWHNE